MNKKRNTIISLTLIFLVALGAGIAIYISTRVSAPTAIAPTAPVSEPAAAGETFTDVPFTNIYYDYIETIYRRGITAGCATNPLRYCPDESTTREQMAVFLLKSKNGGSYTPPAVTSTRFSDVPATNVFAPWIEQLANANITAGCATNPLRYCPTDPVTRGQMAVFLLRTKYGSSYSPPAVTSTSFSDVPGNHMFAAWIEQLKNEGITAGCATNPLRYCPDDPVTRAQMAVFLVKTFGFPLITPTPTPPPVTVGVCGACSANNGCNSGLICDQDDGRCKPQANFQEQICWEGSAVCSNITATSACVASGTITCTPDCPTTCGNPASTISTCVDSCGVATTKACAATSACTEDIAVTKTAYKTQALSSSLTYQYQTPIDTVSKDQTFVYAVYIENTGEVRVNNVTVSDTLNGEHQDLLTFVDANQGCSYTAADKKVACGGISVDPGEKAVRAFRVKVADSAVNGDRIKNIAVVNVNGTEKTAENTVTISTVVGCNNTCTTNAECSSGLVCDGATGKCRKDVCVEEDNCVCPVATAAPTPTPTRTATPRAATTAPTRVATAAPTEAPVQAVEPTVLPETGILDFPGVAAFGGGLLLAIVGILLAL